MAQRAVQQRGLSIRAACQAFRISQACYRYEARRDTEDEEIANRILAIDYDNFKNSVEIMTCTQRTRASGGSCTRCSKVHKFDLIMLALTWSGKVSEWSWRVWRMKEVFYLCENGRNRRLAGNDHDQ
ncbi:transposase [Hydrogenophilus thermoluteolus]|uniref:Transposase n=1 Tax=Hydrogenophilus thermoluteolus TaxID=297 RepID=A0A2Z6DWT3_HYDTE|nr:transposase [Hydrogenophilus thermoluteolus]